jgi:hypothetical protein
MLADAEQVFRCGVHVFDQKTLIDDDDGCIQVLEHLVAPRWITAVPDFPARGFAVA